MKKKITFAAQCSLTALFLACSGSSTDKASDKASANEVNHSDTTVLELTEERFQSLVRNLPDHVQEVSDLFYTQEYCKTFAEALRLPSGGLGEIGNDEFLYYFVCGNDPCDSHSGKMHSIEIVQDTAIIHFDIIHQDTHTTPSTLRLVIKDGEWVIADFNETLSLMKKYIKEQREYISSAEYFNEARAILMDSLSDEYWKDAVRKELLDVEQYFQEYLHYSAGILSHFHPDSLGITREVDAQ